MGYVGDGIVAGDNDVGLRPKGESMKFTQYYLDCLSQASYLIGDETTGRAVVVDPRRDIDEYVRDAAADGLTIELVIETHFHADFLSGHLELAAATGAEIGFSAVAETEFASRKLADGERISLGDVQLEIRHTPGHTPESISIVVWEHADDDVPYGVLTGDALFIGDVGRPDLLASLGFTRDELADKLYDSLHNQLLTLPDATRVYPAHGAGSACGKNLSTETWSTIGDQRVNNYALVAPDRETFVALVTEGQPPAPSYFVYDAVLNRKDRPLLDETPPLVPLDLDEVDQPRRRRCHPARRPLARGVRSRAPRRLGQRRPRGPLRRVRRLGGAQRCRHRARRRPRFRDRGPQSSGSHRVRPSRRIPGRPAGCDGAAPRANRSGLAPHRARVRAPARRGRRPAARSTSATPARSRSAAIAGSVEMPVGQLPGRLDELDTDAPTVVYCAGGYRSSVAASVLRRAGFTDVSDLVGGYGAWLEFAGPTLPAPV